MKIHNLPLSLMAAGILIAVPAFAQTAAVQKQKTQEMLLPSDNPGPNPPLKQRTQDGGTLEPSPNPGPNPPYKLR
jgi:hypothetical protein